MAIEGKKGSSSPSPWNCRLPSEAISFNSEYSLPFSHLTMGPEKASDICQTQMAHLESDCVSVYRESGRINREGVDIYVCWKLLISAMRTWTCFQLHSRRDQKDVVLLRNLVCNGPHLRKVRYRSWTAPPCIAEVSESSNQERPHGKRKSRGLFCDCACRRSKLHVLGPAVNKMQFCLLKEREGR